MNVASPLITSLSLCSGVGWLDEGMRAGLEYLGIQHRVLAYVERESYAASVLLARMEDKSLEPAPIWCGNLEDLPCGQLAGRVDAITAGFPCQPWSAAGKQAGTDDERWIWPAIARIISEIKPALVFLENVPGLVSGGGLEFVLSDLAAQFFDAEGCCLAAADVGASHERERIFILAVHQSRGRGILRQSSERDRLVGGAVKAWHTTKANDSEKRVQTWSTPQARDKTPGAGSTERGGRHRDLNRETEQWNMGNTTSEERAGLLCRERETPQAWNRKR